MRGVDVPEEGCEKAVTVDESDVDSGRADDRSIRSPVGAFACPFVEVGCTMDAIDPEGVRKGGVSAEG